MKTLKCYFELNVSAIALDDFVECLSLYNIPGIVTMGVRGEGYDVELILIPHDPFVIIFIFHTKENAEDGAQMLHLLADIKMTKLY